MSKLYTVTISYDYVLVAESEHEAYQIAAGYAKEALSDMSIRDVDVDIVEGVSAYGWDSACIPYGGDGNTRTSEYLKEQQ